MTLRVLRPRAKIPRALSIGEETFALQCKANDLLPLREFPFHASRCWRFDFCFPKQMIAVEIAGAVFMRGAHGRGKGFSDDCEKYSHAAIAGWRIIHATTAHVLSGVAMEWVLSAMGKAESVNVKAEIADAKCAIR